MPKENQQEELYDWMQYLKNPHAMVIQKYIAQMIPERYANRKELIERICAHLVTQRDVEDFGGLLLDVFESGFIHAVRQYKDEFERLGIPTNIVTDALDKKDQQRIFPNQSEKSG
jgi:hypothetical protein